MLRKRIALVILLVLAALLLASCGNKDYIDTVRTYHEAIIYMPDGSIVRGTVRNWRDYDDGDQIQLRMNDVTYLVHSSNVVLMHNH